MCRYIALCCLFLWYVSVSLGCDLPSYNLSIVSLKDDEGEWYAKVTLDHFKDQPLEFHTNHINVEDRCTEQILIVSKKNGKRPAVTGGHRDPFGKDFCTCPTCPTPGNQSVPNKKNIPPGYNSVSSEGSHYKVFGEKKSWHQSKEICEKDGAHLLILETEQEAADVGYWVELSGLNGNWFWIGFHDLINERTYVTLFNQSITSVYNRWWSGYPQNTEDKDCGLWYYYSSTHGLGDWICASGYFFICEINPVGGSDVYGIF